MRAARGRRPKRRANDPPTIGQPSTHLKAPKPATRGKTSTVLCPCCNKFLARENVWRHCRGKGIPLRTKATQTVKSLADVTTELWKAVKTRFSRSSSSLASSSSSNSSADAEEAPKSPSARSGIFQRLSAKLSPRLPTSNPGSPIIIENRTPPPCTDDQEILDEVEAQARSGDSVVMASPKISEWATHHRRVTVEEVPDVDSCSCSSISSADPHGGIGGEPKGAFDLDMDQEGQNEYARNDAEEEEINGLALEEFERALPELQGKLTEHQIELLRSFVTGNSDLGQVGDNVADEDDLRRLELERQLSIIGEELSENDLKIVRAFALKIQDNLTESTFEKFQYAFPGSGIDTYKSAKARIVYLASFTPLVFDCCPKICLAYTGMYSGLTSCPHCGTERFRNNKPQKRFVYIPIIQRLQTLFRNARQQAEMNHRHKYETSEQDEDTIQDVFDGSNYKKLKGTFVNVEGHQYGHTFFNDPRDIALGLSTDGFCPFKRRKQTCWPIILFNYNLPPDVRFNIHRIICVGVVPGPNKPKDFDSFLWPLVQELLQLAKGVKTYDTVKAEIFQLRAYLIVGFGDYPAMSMVLHMKGHNGVFPCRMCLIEGLLIPESACTTHYVPLNRANHPDVVAGNTRRKVEVYDPADLPLRTHAQFMNHARLVQFADTTAESESLSMGCGIKGIPLLSCLPSLFLPISFPLDFMHLIYENLLKNLVRLWTGTFKDLDHDDQDYYLAPSVWDAIGQATARSGSTIPATYGARPQDIAEHTSQLTADVWSFWAIYLGPVLLQRRFTDQAYYTHFVNLVKLINACLQFSITREEVQQIRVGFQEWVVEYERLYYQNNPERISACPVTIHALLHIADSIEACGPVWTYWAFPMERFCGFLGKFIKNKRFPFANLDANCVAHAQLSHIQNRYDLHRKLNFKPAKDERLRNEVYVHSPEYQGYALVFPRHKSVDLTPGMRDKVMGALARKFDTDIATVTAVFPEITIDVFGRLRQKFSEAGETMVAASVVSPTQDDYRDASYIRYEQDVDLNARFKNKEVVLARRTFYGQLLFVFLIKIPAARTLGLSAPTHVAMAAIHQCDVEYIDPNLDINYYRKMTLTEVVEIQDVKALVGRVWWDGWWAIIDRSGDVNRADEISQS